LAPGLPISAARDFGSPTQHRIGSAKMESAMSTTQHETRTDLQFAPRPSLIARVKKLSRGMVVAGALTAVSLTAMPVTAQAGGPGVGAAIGLGILGGVIAGAAIAATAPPVYAAPPSYYYYPQQGYYYNAAPTYYNAPQPYYGSAAYGYSPYNYQ
jgi:hypothetical protein